jgi:hypothetical protein
MLDSPTFLLIVLAVLIAYLCFSIEKRRRAEELSWLAHMKEERARWQAYLAQTPGADSDVAAIAPRIQRLRQDHRSALLIRPHENYYRRGLIAKARQIIASLEYFHRARPGHEMEKPDVTQS